ncbi:hypothetical protein GGTG_13423 [Gaeumannomyces tritici R3-111a-1]|uniref:Uncharacterized protein n=1 Tax=Gaeumannomyces tritici (strain R3-111a-1) TaxID=644352 RepID=J3PIU3_GAET3|nr:hypothetical protein GGTG_13423 [Gaeumannomyces tritici R3-111a-1]EJT69026.1 hypothetical protein GGTG_13423 [Gaeumannomyces tritici R3-111a-1]
MAPSGRWFLTFKIESSRGQNDKIRLEGFAETHLVGQDPGEGRVFRKAARPATGDGTQAPASPSATKTGDAATVVDTERRSSLQLDDSDPEGRLESLLMHEVMEMQPYQDVDSSLPDTDDDDDPPRQPTPGPEPSAAEMPRESNYRRAMLKRETRRRADGQAKILHKVAKLKRKFWYRDHAQKVLGGLLKFNQQIMQRLVESDKQIPRRRDEQGYFGSTTRRPSSTDFRGISWLRRRVLMVVLVGVAVPRLGGEVAGEQTAQLSTSTDAASSPGVGGC